MRKVIINDVINRAQGKPETELPYNTSIRFEFDEMEFQVRITNEGLQVYKVSNTALEDDRIMTICQGSNMIFIR